MLAQIQVSVPVYRMQYSQNDMTILGLDPSLDNNQLICDKSILQQSLSEQTDYLFALL